MNIGKKKVSLLVIVILMFALFLVPKEVNASAGQVTSSDEVTWGISTGKFTVNGIPAFCAQYAKKRPYTGIEIKEIIPCTNEIMRKALYYGYNGPKNTLGTDERAYVLTAIALSDANIGEAETGVKTQYDAFYWELVNQPSKYPTPPVNFKTYFANTAPENMQNLVFYELEKTGFAKALKVSANAELSSGNTCYSLEGAKYEIYSSAALTSKDKVGTWITDASGNSNTIELIAGTYYVKEINAPKGFQVSEEVVKFDVTSGKTTTIKLTEDPKSVSLSLLIQKLDAETGEKKPQGDASLKGAQFQVRFYPCIYGENENPEKYGVKAIRNWTFETDSEGRVYYDEAYKISGDPLYQEIPLGTILIQEIKPSEGYLLNPNLFVRQMKEETNGLSVYQCPEIMEQVIKVKIKKYQAGTDIPLPDVTFEHIKPDGSKENIVTNTSGEIVLSGLSHGEHIIREVSTMNGYVMDTEIHTFVIDENVTKDLELSIYNETAPYNILIHKTDLFQNLLEGAEFTVYADAECQVEVSRGITDANGILQLSNFKTGTTYYLRETKAPMGYQIPMGEDGKPILYRFYAKSIPIKGTFDFYIDDVLQENDYDVSKNTQDAVIEISNEVDFILPKTGTNTKMLMTMGGITFLGMSIYLTFRKRRKNI